MPAGTSAGGQSVVSIYYLRNLNYTVTRLFAIYAYPILATRLRLGNFEYAIAFFGLTSYCLFLLSAESTSSLIELTLVVVIASIVIVTVDIASGIVVLVVMVATNAFFLLPAFT
mgnify:CR=1 FL=1